MVRLPAMRETCVRFLGWEDPLEKELATHSSTLAWKIPWAEEPGRLQSMGCKKSDTTERLHFHFQGDCPNKGSLSVIGTSHAHGDRPGGWKASALSPWGLLRLPQGSLQAP